MEDFAKTVFLTRTEAESALGRNKKRLAFYSKPEWLYLLTATIAAATATTIATTSATRSVSAAEGTQYEQRPKTTHHCSPF